jgi:hypothetical protein
MPGAPLRFEVTVSQGVVGAAACLGGHSFRAWVSVQMFRLCGDDAMKADVFDLEDRATKDE